MQTRKTGGLGRFSLFAFCILHLALLLAISGCAKAKAATVPDGPPLAVPLPPPREIGPIEEVAARPAPASPAPAEPTAAAPPRTPARPPARPDPKTESPAPVAAQPPPPAPATPEGREIRAVPSTAAAAEERKVKEVLGRASKDLSRVNYQRLTAQGKSQYDQSKRFAEQAEQAIKERNFVYAMTLADKAATLAAELAGR